jgi:predicted nucleic acid-binding protein
VGRLTLPETGRIYVDANTLIYRVELLEPYASASSPIWDGLQDGLCELESSELTLLEVLVKPLKDGNVSLASVYRKILLETVGLTCHPIDRAILEMAANLRATYRLKTPDSIHAATALRHGSSMFLTNDTGFRKVEGLNVAILGEFDPA